MVMDTAEDLKGRNLASPLVLKEIFFYCSVKSSIFTPKLDNFAITTFI